MIGAQQLLTHLSTAKHAHTHRRAALNLMRRSACLQFCAVADREWFIGITVAAERSNLKENPSGIVQCHNASDRISATSHSHRCIKSTQLQIWPISPTAIQGIIVTNNKNQYNLITPTHSLCMYILSMEIHSRKTHSGVMKVAVNWAELITHHALHGLLSRTIMFDGELMRHFSITVKRKRAHCWWHVHTHTGTNEQGHSRTLIFLTHTHTPGSCKRLTFPSHTSALFSSAWIRALVWAKSSSTAGEGLSIPPSICYSNPTSILRAERGDESNTGRKRTSHHHHQLLCDPEDL